MNHEGILRTVVRTKRGHSQVTLRDTRVIALTDWQTSKLSGMVTFYQFSHTILLLVQVTLHIRSPGYSWGTDRVISSCFRNMGHMFAHINV